MNANLEHQLCNKYPEIFKHCYGDPKQSAMAWGLECGDGWYTLIDSLCGMIEHHLKYNAPPDAPPVVALQIKEKFGTLRFYVSGGDTVTDSFIQFAEYFSGKVCEQCGNPGKIRDDMSWLTTLCDHHHEQR